MKKSPLLALKLCLLLCVAQAQNSTTETNRPTVGAIRWDAWLGASSTGIGLPLNRSLGPTEYHWRLPFFSEVLGTDSVNIDGTSQETNDQEITYAAYGHLDYFAYLMYDQDISLSNGLKKYLSSTIKDSINFCVIMNVINTEPITESVERVLSYMQEPTYQRVLENRHLVYTFRLYDRPEFALELKDSCAARGWPEPYIVDLHNADQMPENPVYDGITRYWYGGGSSGGSTNGAPYATLMSYAQENWDQRARAGATQIPLVSLGADGRPRIDNPVPWINDPVGAYAKYFIAPTPEEMTTHLGQAFDFIYENPASCEANTVLMYAWNENDEGGWLMPTLNPGTYDINTDRIDALRSFLTTYEYSGSGPQEDSVLTGTTSEATFGDPNELPAELAFDGLTNTYSEVFKTKGYVQMEFETSEALSRIRFYPRQGFQTRLENAVFQVSEDGITWTDVHLIDYVPEMNQWTDIDLEPNLLTSYARLYHPSNWLTVAEVQFIGTQGVITSTNTPPLEEGFTLYPNPVQDKLPLQLEKEFSFIVSDMKGTEKIVGNTGHHTSIEAAHLPPGTYILKILTEDATYVKKFTK